MLDELRDADEGSAFDREFSQLFVRHPPQITDRGVEVVDRAWPEASVALAEHNVQEQGDESESFQ